MKKYEYKHKTFSKENLTKKLNQLGREGWELILIKDETYYFKREINL